MLKNQKKANVVLGGPNESLQGMLAGDKLPRGQPGLAGGANVKDLIQRGQTETKDAALY